MTDLASRIRAWLRGDVNQTATALLKEASDSLDVDMELMNDYTDAQVRALAEQSIPPAMAGTWVLTAPDGRTWAADSPMRCASNELHDRVPPIVGLARIKRSMLDA